MKAYDKMVIDGVAATLADLLDADGVFIFVLRDNGKHVASTALKSKKDVLRMVGGIEAAKQSIIEAIKPKTEVEDDESEEREDS